MAHEKSVDFDVRDKKGRKRHILVPSVNPKTGKPMSMKESFQRGKKDPIATFSSRESLMNFARKRSAEGHKPRILNPSGSAFSRPSGGETEELRNGFRRIK